MGRCLSREGPSAMKLPKGSARGGGLLAARCCWVLGAMGAEQRESCECRGSLVLENIPMRQKPCARQELSSRQPATLQEPGAGEAAHTL